MRLSLAVLLASTILSANAFAATNVAPPATNTASAPAAAAPAKKPAATDDYVMMRVNGEDVTASEVKRMWEGLFPPGQAPDLSTVKPDVRDKILRGIVVEHLVYNEALKEGIDKSESVQKQLDEIRHKLVVRAFLEAKTADITDKDLHAAYDDMVAGMRDEKEVRARHILVQTKEQALAAKKDLASGKNFADVAKQYSKDPGSAAQGGDLGYFTKDKMVKQFSDAAFSLKKGEISDPVQTPFGWHIIEVEDIRPVTVPTYNEAKDQLKAKAQEKKLDDYLKGMVKTADVKVYDAKGKEQPFSKEIKEEPKK